MIEWEDIERTCLEMEHIYTGRGETGDDRIFAWLESIGLSQDAYFEFGRQMTLVTAEALSTGAPLPVAIQASMQTAFYVAWELSKQFPELPT